MKKFSDFLEQKQDLDGFQAKDYPEDRRIIRNQMVEMFNSMLGNKNGFVKCADFVISNATSNFEQQTAENMVDRVKNFFENPITKGLGYIDGENQIVNSPNPNQNGATNNSYYN